MEAALRLHVERSVARQRCTSIAVSSNFAYSSLRKFAGKKIGPKTSELFKQLDDTDDFERVLLACWHAELVNKLLGTPAVEIRQVYDNIKSALIESVHNLHPPHSVLLTNKLELMAHFASRFRHVVSFNYDLLLYWAMMAWKTREHAGDHEFKDGFTQDDGSFDTDWRRLREPYRCARSTLVFYGHGNLALVRDRWGNERKVKAGENPLLDEIAGRWNAGADMPIFVSEGNAHEKAAAIRRSQYLRTVHEQVLPELGDNIVVYGFGFNPSDEHIMKAVCNVNTKSSNARPKTFAIAIHPSMNAKAQMEFRLRVRQQVGDSRVLYFDATSSGVWTHLSPADRARRTG